MSLIKTPQEIDAMREGGHILSRALKAAVDSVRPGITLREVDAIGEASMRAEGATPSFLHYKSSPSDTPFPSTICLSVNEEVVHGLGNRDRVLLEGDVLGLDIGCWYKGLCTDMAMSVYVGSNCPPNISKLLSVTKEALLAGVAAARVGGDVKDISTAIEKVVTPHKYGNVRALVGHGVGHEVHENPHVPNYVDARYPSVKLVDGMCLALEPMFGLGGDYRVDTAPDGWAIVMKDGSIGAHFEVTIAITKNGTEILTPLPV
ncbi:type I methionyl aminopeptidase [Candidatus Uhrbacteria bacterium RIFCSPHIGHO2_02_FULL_47_44]|uniref:Methionine aminopeptidase n=1 Tax=Candidatus Uhrbacteria bacterium RIFCSPLOWO2_02_FULL_48_18 TaxID=1802408 RepID=A0A1F7V883_9BACT|nr:MAG: type I methionyl aminopeptidase [Candidatus Uhrbacteria bacterium RIFCSPHIGHO2_01_FULL_47_10]OGL70942.1 MAG: type I methionyl aminopeptidase [Candidatus Uhrbacteria bacterium RIFCSPHIGHO2_02_FULL_47_44]OGL76934.1 MAG: type I methionyl aminopeptidase [Candidatus Uhrbacteria bacterium RIFCSPHIGHO2_12_FULL_47_12]OGL80733.1 MAG: type I methionyl aminopeptidase [Candidatus Uhrbacteria bacterium RIFCSPLOWO2_01_FULL_47_17]OGL86615.1 MAG: type I methionyl aminopeptidase [Candidatus Uhrbacteria 